MQASGLSVGDYLAILRRRRMQLLVPMVALFLISVGVAFSIPPVYQSTATILIEQQEIPADLVRSTVTTFADQRIEIINKLVLSRESLQKIMEKYNLYPEDRQAQQVEGNPIDPIEKAVGSMRKDIQMERISGTVIDPRTNRPTEVTIAFTVSYKNKSPELAQKIVAELANLYLEKDARLRTEGSLETSVFLRHEAERLGAEVTQLEEELARFKEQHSQRLPEYTQVNIQMMDRTESELLETQRQMQSVKERKIFLESQLAQISPYSDQTLSAASRLRALQADYASASSRYASNHPDLVRMRKEIESLQKEVGNVSGPDIRQSELAGLRADLAEARKRYSENHPDVKRLERSVAQLEATLRAAPATAPASATNPDNPAYIQLRAQLEAANAEMRSLQTRQEELRAKYALYQERVYEAPHVEREYLALTRDYDNATRKYQDMRAKLTEAQLAVQLERDRKGERFSLIESPSVPQSPVGLNPLAIVLVGAVFSFGGGIGTVAITEWMDRTVQSAKQVMAILGAPPLVGIPYIQNRKDVWRKVWKALLLGTTLIVAGIVLAAVYVHHKVTPLSAAWPTLLQHLGV